jgi:hypothetical protein
MNVVELAKQKFPGFDEEIEKEYASDPDSVRLAVDPEFAAANPTRFQSERYDPYRGTYAQDYINNFYNKLAPKFSGVNNFLGDYRDKMVHGSRAEGLGYGAGAGALAGGLGGLGLALLRGSESPVKDALLMGLLGAGAGALGGTWLNTSYHNSPMLNKSSSFSDLSYIQQKIMSEASIDEAQKYQILNQVRNLPESRISELSRILKTVFGSSVAMVLSRFLGIGSLGTIGMGLLGGFLGFKSHSPYALDAMGRKKLLY